MNNTDDAHAAGTVKVNVFAPSGRKDLESPEKYRQACNILKKKKSDDNIISIYKNKNKNKNKHIK